MSLVLLFATKQYICNCRSRSTKFSRSKFRSTSTAVYTRGCVYIHSTVSLFINGGSFSKEDENIFQKSARVVPVIPQFQMEPRKPIFEKCSCLRKKGGVVMLFLGLCGGLYGQNLPYKFENSYGDFRNRNFEKPHRTTSPRSDLRPDS